MRAGRLDRRCAFERRTVAADGYGNERGAWAALLTVWGELRPVAPREAEQGSVARSAEEADLRIRDSSAARGIVAGDRVVIDGRTFAVLGDAVQLVPRSGVLTIRLRREA